MKKISAKKLLQLSIILCLLVVVFLPSTATNASFSGIQPLASVRQTENPIVIYFFWGDGCPHCAEAEPFLENLVDQNPDVMIKRFEVWNNEQNLNLLREFSTAFKFEASSVPTIFIGEKHWEGFNELISEELTKAIKDYQKSGYVDMGAPVLEKFTGTPEMTLYTAKGSEPTVEPTIVVTPEVDLSDNTENTKVINIPLIGKVDISKQSMFLSTLLIAFVDGFNPCSIWVLSMLLAITLHTGSRKKVLIIGLVFLTVTAAIYALFIAGLFTMFTVISFVGWIQVVVALVALFFALVNIKDYFWYKEGVSFTIDDKKKPGIYQKIRKVMDAGDSFWGLVGGTIVLAAGVSLVEFSCTAGFPVLWTNLLSAQKVTAITFVVLLLVYMLIYQLDELGIFLVAVFTLKSSKIEEKHGRILKLIGGVLMLTLAIVMLVKPAIMSDLGKSMVVFGIAFAATLVILLLHRVVLPKLGIHIGSEFSKTKSKRKKR